MVVIKNIQDYNQINLETIQINLAIIQFFVFILQNKICLERYLHNTGGWDSCVMGIMVVRG